MSLRPLTCASALTVLLAACSSMHGASRQASYTAAVALPADLAAAVCAGAVRAALPFADPLPNTPGAPACRLADGCFEIVFEQDAGGHCTPSATHRLMVVAAQSYDAVYPTVLVQALTGNNRLPALGSRAAARIHLCVRSTAVGSLITGTLPAPLAESLRQAIDRSLLLAVDPTAVSVGLSEPNLAALAAHRLLAQAESALRAGQPLTAQALLQQVARLGAESPRLHERLGELAAQMGDHAFAREQLWQALLVADDPTTRQHLAQRLAAVEATAIARAPLRRAARDRLAILDMAGAEALLHTARRRWPQPAEDYRLQSRVHRQRENDMAAMACSLLAREHEAGATALVAWTGSLLQSDFRQLARRLAGGIEPALAAAITETPRLLPAAAPAR